MAPLEHLESVEQPLVISGAVLVMGGETGTLPLLLAPPPPPPPPTMRLFTPLTVSAPARSRRRHRRIIGRRATPASSSAPPPQRLLLPAPSPATAAVCETILPFSVDPTGRTDVVTLVETALDGGLVTAESGPAGGAPPGGYTLSVLTRGDTAGPLTAPGESPVAPLLLARLPGSAPSAVPPPTGAVLVAQDAAAVHSEALSQPVVWEAAMLSEQLSLPDPVAGAGRGVVAELGRPSGCCM